MEKLMAKAVIAERLRDFAFCAPVLCASDVRSVMVWLKSDEFLLTCADAGADPKAVEMKFEELANRGLDAALSSL